MLSKTRTTDVQERDFFRVLLVDLVSQEHLLAQLAREIDWNRFEVLLTGLFSSSQGRHSCPVRLMVGLLMLKELSGLGGKALLAQWTENPYWQYFTGGVYFETQVPVALRSLTRWQHRLRHCGGDELLAEMLGAGRRRRRFAPVWAVRSEPRPRKKAVAAKAASAAAKLEGLLLPLL